MYLTWEYQKYIKQLLIDLWGEIDSTTIIGDFNTPLISMDRPSRQKSTKKERRKWEENQSNTESPKQDTLEFHKDRARKEC